MATKSENILSTTFTVEGSKIKEYRGLVRGITVRSPTIVQGIFGGLKSILGGTIGAYSEMCEQAREQAYELMLDHTVQMGQTRCWAFIMTHRKLSSGQQR
jgi:uncharacterized protein YbjQ (UPF0145 family)